MIGEFERKRIVARHVDLYAIEHLQDQQRLQQLGVSLLGDRAEVLDNHRAQGRAKRMLLRSDDPIRQEAVGMDRVMQRRPVARWVSRSSR